MTQADRLSFEYRLRLGDSLRLVLVALLLPIAAAFLAMRHEPTAFFGLLLTARQATMMFWALAALTSICSVVALWVTHRTRRWSGVIELNRMGATLPRAHLGMAMAFVPFASITGIQVVDIVRRQQMLVVRSPLGESRLLSKCFASPTDFRTFVSMIQLAHRAAQSGRELRGHMSG